MKKDEMLKLVVNARNYAYDLIDSIHYNGYCATGTEGQTWYYWQDMSRDLKELHKIINQLKQTTLFNKINAKHPLPIDNYNKKYRKATANNDIPEEHAEIVYKSLARDNTKLLHYIWKDKTDKDIKNKTFRDLATLHRIAYKHKDTDLAILKDPQEHNAKVLCIKKGSKSGYLRRDDCKQAKKFLQSTIDNDLAYLNMFKTLYNNRNVWFQARDNQELYQQIDGNIGGIKYSFLSHKKRMTLQQRKQKELDKKYNKLMHQNSDSDSDYVPSDSDKAQLGLRQKDSWIMVSIQPHDIMHNGIKYRTLDNVMYQQVV